jgi:hypothetical protein
VEFFTPHHPAHVFTGLPVPKSIPVHYDLSKQIISMQKKYTQEAKGITLFLALLGQHLKPKIFTFYQKKYYIRWPVFILFIFCHVGESNSGP